MNRRSSNDTGDNRKDKTCHRTEEAYRCQFLARLADDPAKALREYYTLTPEEIAALASGDIKKIEGWLGKLDKRHATWLWCRLSQEKW